MYASSIFIYLFIYHTLNNQLYHQLRTAIYSITEESKDANLRLAEWCNLSRVMVSHETLYGNGELAASLNCSQPGYRLFFLKD